MNIDEGGTAKGTGKLGNELAAYVEAMTFAEVLEASSLGSEEAVAARQIGMDIFQADRTLNAGYLAELRYSDIPVTASELAGLIAVHFDNEDGMHATADVWFATEHALTREPDRLPGVTVQAVASNRGHQAHRILATWASAMKRPRVALVGVAVVLTVVLALLWPPTGTRVDPGTDMTAARMASGSAANLSRSAVPRGDARDGARSDVPGLPRTSASPFQRGSADFVDPQQERKLEEVVRGFVRMAKSDNRTVTVTTFGSDAGAVDQSTGLASRRAEVVREFLNHHSLLERDVVLRPKTFASDGALIHQDQVEVLVEAR